jgi:hypothetical protein
MRNLKFFRSIFLVSIYSMLSCFVFVVEIAKPAEVIGSDYTLEEAVSSVIGVADSMVNVFVASEAVSFTKSKIHGESISEMLTAGGRSAQIFAQKLTDDIVGNMFRLGAGKEPLAKRMVEFFKKPSASVGVEQSSILSQFADKTLVCVKLPSNIYTSPAVPEAATGVAASSATKEKVMFFSDFLNLLKLFCCVEGVFHQIHTDVQQSVQKDVVAAFVSGAASESEGISSLSVCYQSNPLGSARHASVQPVGDNKKIFGSVGSSPRSKMVNSFVQHTLYSVGKRPWVSASAAAAGSSEKAPLDSVEVIFAERAKANVRWAVASGVFDKHYQNFVDEILELARVATGPGQPEPDLDKALGRLEEESTAAEKWKKAVVDLGGQVVVADDGGVTISGLVKQSEVAAVQAEIETLTQSSATSSGELGGQISAVQEGKERKESELEQKIETRVEQKQVISHAWNTANALFQDGETEDLFSERQDSDAKVEAFVNVYKQRNAALESSIGRLSVSGFQSVATTTAAEFVAEITRRFNDWNAAGSQDLKEVESDWKKIEEEVFKGMKDRSATVFKRIFKEYADLKKEKGLRIEEKKRRIEAKLRLEFDAEKSKLQTNLQDGQKKLQDLKDAIEKAKPLEAELKAIEERFFGKNELEGDSGGKTKIEEELENLFLPLEVVREEKQVPGSRETKKELWSLAAGSRAVTLQGEVTALEASFQKFTDADETPTIEQIRIALDKPEEAVAPPEKAAVDVRVRGARRTDTDDKKEMVKSEVVKVTDFARSFMKSVGSMKYLKSASALFLNYGLEQLKDAFGQALKRSSSLQEGGVEVEGQPQEAVALAVVEDQKELMDLGRKLEALHSAIVAPESGGGVPSKGAPDDVFGENSKAFFDTVFKEMFGGSFDGNLFAQKARAFDVKPVSEPVAPGGDVAVEAVVANDFPEGMYFVIPWLADLINHLSLDVFPNELSSSQLKDFVVTRDSSAVPEAGGATPAVQQPEQRTFLSLVKEKLGPAQLAESAVDSGEGDDYFGRVRGRLKAAVVALVAKLEANNPKQLADDLVREKAESVNRERRLQENQQEQQRVQTFISDLGAIKTPSEILEQLQGFGREPKPGEVVLDADQAAVVSPEPSVFAKTIDSLLQITEQKAVLKADAEKLLTELANLEKVSRGETVDFEEGFGGRSMRKMVDFVGKDEAAPVPEAVIDKPAAPAKTVEAILTELQGKTQVALDLKKRWKGLDEDLKDFEVARQSALADENVTSTVTKVCTAIKEKYTSKPPQDQPVAGKLFAMAEVCEKFLGQQGKFNTENKATLTKISGLGEWLDSPVVPAEEQGAAVAGQQVSDAGSLQGSVDTIKQSVGEVKGLNAELADVQTELSSLQAEGEKGGDKSRGGKGEEEDEGSDEVAEAEEAVDKTRDELASVLEVETSDTSTKEQFTPVVISDKIRKKLVRYESVKTAVDGNVVKNLVEKFKGLSVVDGSEGEAGRRVAKILDIQLGDQGDEGQPQPPATIGAAIESHGWDPFSDDGFAYSMDSLLKSLAQEKTPVKK